MNRGKPVPHHGLTSYNVMCRMSIFLGEVKTLYQGSDFETQYSFKPSSKPEAILKVGFAARTNKQALEILSARPAKQMRRLVFINLGSGKSRSLTRRCEGAASYEKNAIVRSTNRYRTFIAWTLDLTSATGHGHTI